MEYAIEVKNVIKNFRIYYDKGVSLKEKILFKNRNKFEERTVLNGITFQVRKGESVGLIGQNGCGKSTILKLINKIIYPDAGQINTKGRISSLIELGAGFHPDMTGRENIYTNASIFGLSHKEISDRFEEIVRFSEMEEFLDNPVRTYSSGMYMRLAFSVAINVNADILLIDEILGVGDVSFQAKCFEKLREIKAQGTTIVIVSHSLSQLEQICDRSIWFENGQIEKEGIPKYVHEAYLFSMEQKRLKKIEDEYQEEIKHFQNNISHDNNLKLEISDKEDKFNITTSTEPNILNFTDAVCDSEGTQAETQTLRLRGQHISWGAQNAIRRGNQKAYFTDAYLLDSLKMRKKVFRTGENVTLVLEYKNSIPDLHANVGYAIYRDDGLYCYGTNCIFELGVPLSLKDKGKIVITMPSILLLPNKYFFDIAIQTPDGIEYDNICFAIELQILMNKLDTGICRIAGNWQIE